ncbi:unnamed protein product [Wickerhamomyces anomalus]
MVKIESKTHDVGFPVYGAKFFDDKTLVVTGGGGEGNNGIPNKITVLNVDYADSVQLESKKSFEIEGKNDSPTCLDISGNTVLIGCNENSTNIKNGQNKHLRKFKLTDEKEITFDSSADIEETKDPNDYQKFVTISKDDVIDEKDEINDVHISPNSKQIAYITDSSLVVVENSEKPILKYDRFAPTYNLTKVKFTKDGDLIVAVNLRNKLGVLLAHVIFEDDALRVKKARVVNSKTQKITALDVSDKLVAVSGNDSSIIIAGLRTF